MKYIFMIKKEVSLFQKCLTNKERCAMFNTHFQECDIYYLEDLS